MRLYWHVITESIGIKRVLFMGAIGLVGTCQDFALAKGWIMNPVIPPFAIYVVVPLTFAFWWVLQYAVSIKKKLQPKIKISFDSDSYFDLESTPVGAFYMDGAGIKTFWVRLENESLEAVENCKLNIKAIEGEDGNQMVDFVGSLTRRSAQGEVFSLGNGDSEDVNIICLDETDPNSEIKFCYWGDRLKGFSLPPGEYKISLSAVGLNTTASAIDLFVWVDEDKKLALSKIKREDNVAR